MAHLELPELELPASSHSVPPKHTSKARRKKRTQKRRSATPKSARTSRRVHFKNGLIPKKLGPREIGRNKYPEGTKYIDPDSSHFLLEKIHRRSRSACFLERKRMNPVPKRPTVQQTGTPHFWQKPEYYDAEVEKMYAFHNAKRKGWGVSTEFLTEKPLKPKDWRLEALKDTKIPKGKPVNEYGSPNSWKPIAFKYKNIGGGFLDEKFWFEGSHVEVDGALSKLIQALPPQKKLKLDSIPAPTGYQSKINFLIQLRDLVMKEVKRLHKEDTMIQQMETNAFIDGISKEIEQEYEKELDEALDEVLAQYDDEKKKKDDISLNIIYDDDEDKESNDDNDGSLTNKYAKLIERTSSPFGMYQRKMFTMQSINNLTNIIDGMENNVTE